MRITSRDLALLVPVFRVTQRDLKVFFEQIHKLSDVPHVYFVYEEASCEFEFTNHVSELAELYAVNSSVMTVSGRRGIGYALNYAVSKIAEPFVVRHDLGDDLISERFTIILELLNQETNVDIIYSQAILDVGGAERLSNYPNNAKGLEKAFIFSNPICHPTVVFRRKAIIDLGNYDPNLRFCEDLDLWLRAFKQNLKFFCLQTPTIRYFAPTEARVNKNWRSNLKVRLKNFGSPNLLHSMLGIILVTGFLVLPAALKRTVYKSVK